MRKLGTPLPRKFYARDTVEVARSLLGCILETFVDGDMTAGRIVEVEAYVGAGDPAAHGFGGRQTARNASMFGPPGTVYVYRSYGIHWCVNLVTERIGVPAAVLIRALEPMVGLDTMRRRRATERPRLLCAGPGRVCQALGIAREHDGVGAQRRPVRVLRPSSFARPSIAVSPRIGITKAADWPLRFYVRDSCWLSRAARSSRASYRPS